MAQHTPLEKNLHLHICTLGFFSLSHTHTICILPNEDLITEKSKYSSNENSKLLSHKNSHQLYILFINLIKTLATNLLKIQKFKIYVAA